MTGMSQPNAAGSTEATMYYQPVAKLLNRFGRKIATLSALRIEYPVGRSGTRFEAVLSTGALYNLDTSKLGFFVVQDSDGNQYPAMIDHVAASSEAEPATLIRGVLVSS